MPWYGNCRIAEKSILKFFFINPAATQTEVASAIGESLRTVKTGMMALRRTDVVLSSMNNHV